LTDGGLLDLLFAARVASVLDLHGRTASEAREAVRSFLSLAARRWPGSVVHIITGKGRGSVGRPVLRGAVAGMLRGELAPRIADWARDADEGGFLVRLR
jgi:DNA-nicking Smr family endonuclease